MDDATACCERDHDNDGNCDRHPATGPLVNQLHARIAELEALLEDERQWRRRDAARIDVFVRALRFVAQLGDGEWACSVLQDAEDAANAALKGGG